MKNKKTEHSSNGIFKEVTGRITYRYPPRYNEVVIGTKIPDDGTSELKQNLAGKRGSDGAKKILTKYYKEKEKRQKTTN